MPNTPILRTLQTAYGWLIYCGEKFQSVLLLLIRLCWGYGFFEAGKGKLMDLEKPAAFFASLGIPFPKINALLAGSTECFGGLLLMLGLGSRLISLPLAFTMLVAYATAHRDTLDAIFHTPDSAFNLDPFLEAAPFLFLLASLIVLAFGPGVFSLDWLLARKFGKQPAKG